jgi:RND superfamily putative drug exporter
MFHRIGRFSASYPWIVCVAWVILGGVLAFLAPNWDTRTQDDDVRFLPQRVTSVRAYQILEKAFPDDVFASRLIFAVERDDKVLSSQDFELVDLLVDDLRQLKNEDAELKIGSVACYQDGLIGSRLTSEDGKCTLIQVSLSTPFLALQTQSTVDRAEEMLRKRIDAAGAGAPQLYTTGQAGIGRDLTQACGQSLDDTTLATVLLVIVVLLVVYRAPLLALIPLVTIAVSVFVAMQVLAMITLIPGVYLVNISKIFAIVILYGAGTDYCLFLISRYREELESGSNTHTALANSVGHVGGALTASAGTVMCGLGLMAIAEFAKVRYSGPGIALSLGIALAASLTITPALLSILGRFVFWPLRAPEPNRDIIFLRKSQEDSRGFWNWISHGVAKRPGLVLVLSIFLLMPLAYLGFHVQPDYRATSQLSPSTQSLQGMEVLKKHFPAGETGPLTVLLVSSKNWDSRTGEAEIDHLSRGFGALDNVAEVRSLTQPLGKPLVEETKKSNGMALLFNLIETVQPKLLDGVFGAAKKAAGKHYLSQIPAEPDSEGKPRYVTRIDVILKSDPFDPASVATMKQIQSWLREELPRTTLMPPGDLQAETCGVMVSATDLASVTESDRLRVNTLISIGIFLILLVIVRRPALAAYLLVTVLFSYFATLGATMLVGTLWTGEPLQQLDWRVMFFLFTILIAVGEDYNILLVSRAVQEAAKHGAIEGMRRALARTGGTITSCGLIMAGTFATLMLANLNTLLQIGFALAFGVMLDTFVIRPFLVPSFIMLFFSEPPQKPEKKAEIAYLKKVPSHLRAAG